ncbi:TetR/AcrR family transcriptional regulator [Actinoplanes regularis]|uniref:Transcriptional regulator, TetR family n=1 Tax=Actinoplanes regularis TaxID=52697 RepID=A0A239J3Z2_9ACTN|nr:TetR/AcrR family transcriptional regulator [Actinoplanes regularis]GIE89714.1 TetR family transcriptional regulator [Actinoplanes regularis]SNT00525.1 transcriptional regulator, TetR family [Actinoplanes regularis]
MKAETTRLRADAQRNRDHIVSVARVVFAEIGPGAPMDEIARRAGVGVGTLYRRFPDRGSLLRAVALESLSAILADAHAAIAEEPAAWDALTRIVRRAVDLRFSTHVTMMDEHTRQALKEAPDFRHTRAAVLDLVEHLVERAQAEGSMRSDVGAGDVFAVVSLLLKPPPSRSAEMSDLLMRRCLTLILDGLHPGGQSVLPGEPVSITALHLDS